MATRTKNWFYTSSRFLSGAFWKDVGAGFLLWPAVWIEPTKEPALDVTITRLSVGWLQWRAQCDFGQWSPVSLRGPLDWERLGVDSYLAWAKKTFGRSWNRSDVERLFKQDPAWRRLCLLGTLNNHYIRVAVARSMLVAQDTPLKAVGDGSAEPVVSSPDSMMEGLEDLGRNLKRKEVVTED